MPYDPRKADKRGTKSFSFKKLFGSLASNRKRTEAELTRAGKNNSSTSKPKKAKSTASGTKAKDDRATPRTVVKLEPYVATTYRAASLPEQRSRKPGASKKKVEVPVGSSVTRDRSGKITKVRTPTGKKKSTKKATSKQYRNRSIHSKIRGSR